MTEMLHLIVTEFSNIQFDKNRSSLSANQVVGLVHQASVEKLWFSIPHQSVYRLRQHSTHLHLLQLLLFLLQYFLLLVLGDGA